MRTLLVLLLFASSLAAQTVLPFRGTFYKQISAEEFVATDSMLVCSIPARSILRGAHIFVDTAFTCSSLALGISGDDADGYGRFWRGTPPHTGRGFHVPLYYYDHDVRGTRYIYDTPVSLSIGGDTEVPDQLRGMDTTNFHGFREAANRSKFAVPAFGDGLYKFSASISFQADKVGTALGEWHHGTEAITSASFKRSIGTTAQMGSVSAQGARWCAAGDSLTFWLEYSTVNTELAVAHCTLIAERIRDEVPYSTTAAKSLYLYTTGTVGATGRMHFYLDIETLP